jgi:hypothetical protein
MNVPLLGLAVPGCVLKPVLAVIVMVLVLAITALRRMLPQVMFAAGVLRLRGFVILLMLVRTLRILITRITTACSAIILWPLATVADIATGRNTLYPVTVVLRRVIA